MTILHAMEHHLGVISHIPEGVERFHTWDHSTWTFRTTFRTFGPIRTRGPFARGTFRIFVPGMFCAYQIVGLRREGSDASRARTIRILPSNPGSQGARHDPTARSMFMLFASILQLLHSWQTTQIVRLG